MAQKQQSLSTLIDTDVKVALPELTDIFISDLETKLYNEKERLTRVITEVKKEIQDHQKQTAKEIDFSKYLKGGFPAMDIKARLDDAEVGINWKDGKANKTIVIFTVMDKGQTMKIGGVTVYEKVPAAAMKKHTQLQERSANLSNDLNNIMNQITDLPRKERQVRARISAMKLEDAGHSNLLQDKVLLQLVQMG